MTPDAAVRPSRFMHMGDRIVIESADQPDFEAEVMACLGWSLVNGVMDWKMRRDDGPDFTYAIHIDAPVRVLT